MHTPGTDGLPTLKKPSQQYVDAYIARRGYYEAAACSTPPLSVPPLGGADAAVRGRHAPRIFYALDKECPPVYYSQLRQANPAVIRVLRLLLLLLCSTQAALSLALLYAASTTRVLHDSFSETFTEAVLSLCAFAALAGLVGVCARSRPMLLFFYINQLWSLANVTTFTLANLGDDAQVDVACRLYAKGELSLGQVRDRGLDCDGQARLHAYLNWSLALLVGHLLVGCFFSKVYSNNLQDVEADEVNRGIVNFVWQRRGEIWSKLEKFEDIVQRQFEELRLSLVAHAHHAQSSARGHMPTPLAHSTPPPQMGAVRPAAH